MSDTVIEVRNLVNAFGAQRVHDGLNLSVRRGEVLGIVGGSGTGKSVLLRSMLGLHRFTAGSVEVMGRAVNYHESSSDTCWGVLFQSGALLSGLTVRENVELPMAIHSSMDAATRRDLAMLKLRMTGLPDIAGDKYPAELSGGMVKRAALARALAREPKILFLDEPTAGLDPIAATEFDELVRYLQTSLDLTVVMITHDVDSLYGICDRIAVLVDKRIVVGTAEEISRYDHPWIARYFGGPRARRANASSIDAAALEAANSGVAEHG
ncbi:MAG: ATP-binding cassette domain-containing protein [Pseudomonadota bacterium]